MRPAGRNRKRKVMNVNVNTTTCQRLWEKTAHAGNLRIAERQKSLLQRHEEDEAEDTLSRRLRNRHHTEQTRANPDIWELAF